MRRRREKSSSRGVAAWFVTYSDMVTLLLTFFVMLYSFSTINAQKWEALVQSLRGNIGVLEGGASLDRLPGVDDTSIPQIDLERLDGYRKDKEEAKPGQDPFLKLGSMSIVGVEINPRVNKPNVKRGVFKFEGTFFCLADSFHEETVY